jgi:hypothetical protein
MNSSDSFHDGESVDESNFPNQQGPDHPDHSDHSDHSDHADAVTPDGGAGMMSDHGADRPPEELIGIEEQVAFLLRSDCNVDAERSASIAASVFKASLPSLPAHTLPITAGQSSPWARRVAVASGLAAAACIAMVAWIGMNPALTETGTGVQERRVAKASDEVGIFAASMGESRDSEALLAAVLGGDGDWLDDASFTTVAFRDVRPVMDSWSFEVDDLEDEIRSILARPAS